MKSSSGFATTSLLRFSSHERSLHSRGFTLVELLIVVAILGILAVGLIAAINPLDKLNAAGDARVISDMGVLSRASEAYYIQYQSYPDTIPDLVSSQLKTSPIAPAGYNTYGLTPTPAGCSNVGPTYCTSLILIGQLKSSKYSSTPVIKFESTTGKTCQVGAAPTPCP